MTDLFPTLGHEQSGFRPVIVIGNKSYNSVSNMTLICPITSTNRKSPAHIEINTPKIKGFAMCDQIRSIDLSIRESKFVETLDTDTLWQVIDTVHALTEIL